MSGLYAQVREGRATCAEHTTDIPCPLCESTRKRQRHEHGAGAARSSGDSASTLNAAGSSAVASSIAASASDAASAGTGTSSSPLAIPSLPIVSGQASSSSSSSRSSSKRARPLPSVGPSLSQAKKRHRASDAARDALVRSVTGMLEAIGEDPTREGIRKTPERVCKSMQFLTKGYTESVEDVVGDALFHEDHHGMVITSCDVFSMCEHHLLPFFGKVHVAYIPRNKIVGLSKIARVVEVFARRLSVQERLTKQVADAINRVLAPLGVAVVVECVHMCMMARGVQKTTATTTTSSVLGVFAEDPKTRAEFFSHIDNKRLRTFM